MSMTYVRDTKSYVQDPSTKIIHAPYQAIYLQDGEPHVRHTKSCLMMRYVFILYGTPLTLDFTRSFLL